MSTKKYIVTPIYYANGLPHIGHFLTTTVADALARFYRKKLGSENVFFTTGIDEHGTSVEQAALAEGYDFKDFQKYVDKRAQEWEEAFQNTLISYDYFVRTTNPKHEQFAQNFIRKMVEKGDVYKDKYTGKYCNGCEKFLTLSDLDENGGCPLHRKDQVIEIIEENYFFKLSKYALKLKELIQKEEIKIIPENKKAEMVARIDAGIDDLSISRPRSKVGWGVSFPDDNDQTIYVWVEALLNYLSSLEINNNKEFWEGATHLLGKDINWFHNVIWPAFLLSAEYPLYKYSYVHSFLNVSGQKISKSLGNMITPKELINKYGADGARYVTLTNLPHKDDTDITWESLDEKYNADLANGLGNTVARLAKLAEKSEIEFDVYTPDKTLWEREWAKPFEDFRIDLAIQNIWKKLSLLDKHINDNEPWAITDKGVLETVLKKEINSLREIADIVEPIIPETSIKVLEQIGGSKIKAEKPLFPRVG
jgi:methionyl-tRNA synthetase